MRVTVTRKHTQFLPDSSRVITRFFMNGDERTISLVNRLQAMEDDQVSLTIENTLREFARRHRNISKIFFQNCERIQGLIEYMGIDYSNLSKDRKMLIGSYLTMEYSIESAAFFNPSMFEDINQSNLSDHEKRIIISFRATGEGHISSVVFRRGVLDNNNNLKMMPVGKHVDKAEVTHKKLYDKSRFINRMKQMQIPEKYSKTIMDGLSDKFEYYVFKKSVDNVLKDHAISNARRMALEEVTWLADSFYDVAFQRDSDISARVLFPISDSESKGIEDARFVRFIEDDGTKKTFATYTAYNGHTILPKLLYTDDFYTFRVMPMHGLGARNKNLALFPKKINGQYAMLARIDGVNNYLMYSDRNTVWNDPKIIQEPKYPWEFTQIGNCGSPLLTKEGWLVISHGVGPMRQYCLGASLFDLDDPSKEIGRLSEPLLAPLEEEREGYVPNVVYSCGSMIHNNSLILPYAVSDYSSTYGVVELEELFQALK